MDFNFFVGVDISAYSAEIAVQSANGEIIATVAVQQSESEFHRLSSQLLMWVGAASNALVVMEATGNYWIKLACHLHDAGFAVSVINPVRAYHLARMHLKKAKTDQIDACLLADFGRVHQPACWTPPPPIYPTLQQYLTQRDSFVQIRTQIRNQIHALRQHQHIDPQVLLPYQAEVDNLNQHIDAIDSAIASFLRDDPTWSQSASLLATLPGLGPVTIAWILVSTLNFTCCLSPEEAAAYPGLVPYPRHSGTNQSRKTGIGHGGHRRLRTALYMATLSGNQHNPILKSFSQRLLARGKHKKVARCASARKLLHIAWAVVSKQQPFDPHYQAT